MSVFPFRITCSCVALCSIMALAWSAEEAPRVTRTTAEVKALVREAGKTPAEWLADTPLNAPRGLSLRWSNRSRAWNPTRNIEHYLAAQIDPNPDRLKEGIKLLHHVTESNKNNQDKSATKRSMRELAHRYCMLGDYAHALWYYGQGGAKTIRDANDIIGCHKKLGDAATSANLTAQAARPDTKRFAPSVRQWAEAGNLPVALKLAEGIVKSGNPGRGHLAAGDACRAVGDFKQAQEFYTKSFGASKTPGDRKRAHAGLTAARGLDGLDLATIKDGTYAGTADGAYRGKIGVQVTVKDGKLAAVKITQTRENRDFHSQTIVPAKIVVRQGVHGVDSVTGATLTSVTIMNAVGHALAQARQ
jgi:uncharacterized protein with FMN-binding domain